MGRGEDTGTSRQERGKSKRASIDLKKLYRDNEPVLEIYLFIFHYFHFFIFYLLSF